LNKAQRKKLEDIVENISVIKIDIEEIKEAEEDSFSNLPENLQEEDRGLIIQNPSLDQWLQVSYRYLYYSCQLVQNFR
jgi:hypothetical protein